MSRDLYVFDLDYTLIDADSSTLWCRYMVENHIAEDPDFLNKEKRLMDAYDRGELNVHDYIAFSMPPITKIPKEKVDAIVDDFVKNTFSNLIFKEAKELLNELKSQNESILLLSASADMIVNAVARYLGIKEAISVNIKVENITAIKANSATLTIASSSVNPFLPFNFIQRLFLSLFFLIINNTPRSPKQFLRTYRCLLRYRRIRNLYR